MSYISIGLVIMASFGWLSFRCAPPSIAAPLGRVGKIAGDIAAWGTARARSCPREAAGLRAVPTLRTSPPAPSIANEVGAEMPAGIHANTLPGHGHRMLDQEQRGACHVDRPDAALEWKLGVGLMHARLVLRFGHDLARPAPEQAPRAQRIDAHLRRERARHADGERVER